MFNIISDQTGISKKQIQAVAELLEQGATIPFMARYRKEATGSLDEVAITVIREAVIRFKELEGRRSAILKSLQEREILTDVLKTSIENTATFSELEDIYQKYRPKKRTRAMIAREKGLEPLAKLIMAIPPPVNCNPINEAARFVTRAEEDSEKRGTSSINSSVLTENVSASSAVTDALTGTATDAVTGTATDAVTGTATDAVTGAATDAVTGNATGAVTGAATDAVTGNATGAVTGAAVNSAEEALAGARDIAAETINEDISIRRGMRHLFFKEASLSSRVKKSKEEEGMKYRDYFDWSEHASSAPSHRVLAMLRGGKEGILTIHALPPEEKTLNRIEKLFITEKLHHASLPSYQSFLPSHQSSLPSHQSSLPSHQPSLPSRQPILSPHSRQTTESTHSSSPWRAQLQLAIKDSCKRLLGPAMENEALKILKEKADEAAIHVFARNMQELLLSAPLGQKAILAIDPGFRTGCKVVCLNRQGILIDHDVIFPMGEGSAARKASDTILHLVGRHHIEALAIGNGTAGRETEQFIRNIGLPPGIPVIMVDESGASIYSASQCARDEFPDHDITVRGAVSIGRRLMDPLAELVKIDPKSIGVGQYQHDVDQKKLQQALDDVVTTCVNRVGAELNTASRELLCQIAGLNQTTAGNIVKYRDEHGPFASRKALLKVPRLGPKAFEQCAGFLRIYQGKNPLDASGIHPESYGIVEKMALDKGVKAGNLIGNKSLVNTIDLNSYVTENTGMPTLRDITTELLRPGRDPRESFKVFTFAEHVHEISDLIQGMKLPGIITNVTAFGAFIDIGVHQDGLVHVSQLADHFVKNPADEVKVRQQVEVTVLEVDIKRKRISLSMKNNI